MSRTVVGLFDRWEDAQAAVHAIEASGIRDRSISVVGNRGGRGAIPETETVEASDRAIEGVSTGATAGAMIGTGVGLLAGLGALTIPGIGPLVAAGPLVTALTGAGVGAATGALTGGLVGALASIGVPEHHAGAYEEGVRRGGTLVIVSCDESNVPPVIAAMDRNHVADIEQRVRQYRDDQASGQAPDLGDSLGRDEFVEDFPAPHRERLVGQGMEGYAGEFAVRPSLDTPSRETASVPNEERPGQATRPSALPRDTVMTDDSAILDTDEDRRDVSP